MPIDLLSYQGNAGLGLGSNPNIPVSANPNTFDILAETTRNIAQQSANQNALLFQQKVRDRDNILNMIAADQVQTGDVLPEYRKDIETAVEEQKKAFDKWRGNPNDTKGYSEYKEAHQKALDLAKIAQLNTIQIKANRAAKSQDPIQSHWKNYDEFEKRQMDKGLNGIVDPYQRLTYLNPDTMLPDLLQGAFISNPIDVTKKTTVTDKAGKVATAQVTTEKPAPPSGSGVGGKSATVSVGENGQLSPLSKSPDKVFNYGNVLGWAATRFLQGDVGKENQEQLISGVENLPAKGAIDYIESINDRIRAYNDQTKGKANAVGLLQKGKDYEVIINPQTGKEFVHITADTPTFAAKWALANYRGNYFEPGTTSFNKDIGKYLQDNEELKLKRAKLGLDGMRARAYVDNMKAKTEHLKDAGDSPSEVTAKANKFFDDVQLNMVVETKDESGKRSIAQPGSLFFIDNLPSGYENVVMAVDSNGKLINSPIKPFILNGKRALKGAVYNAKGEEIGTEKWLKDYYKASQKNGYTGSFKDYTQQTNKWVSDKIKDGTFHVVLKDADDNRIDVQSISDAYKNLNNAGASKKGQDKLFIESEEQEEE